MPTNPARMMTVRIYGSASINCTGIKDLAGNPIDLLHPAATIN